MTEAVRVKVRVQQYGTFSDAQWEEIKASLAERGVVLDTEMVGARFVPGKSWWSPDGPSGQRPLREALQDMAYLYAVAKSPTPKQRAKKLKQTQLAVQSALAMLNADRPARNYPDRDQLRAHAAKNDALCALMTWKIADLRARRANLEEMGSRSAESARTLYGDYWHELTRLWLGITGKAGSKRRQQLRRFLLACTTLELVPNVSMSLFPNMSMQELERKIDSFISNYFSRGHAKSRGA